VSTDWGFQSRARSLSSIRRLARDTGPGIAPAIRDSLFEPFVSAGKKNGLGLGLALSRQTVLDHGGEMWAESEPGQGACFRVRLPAAKQRGGDRDLTSAERLSYNRSIWKRTCLRPNCPSCWSVSLWEKTSQSHGPASLSHALSRPRSLRVTGDSAGRPANSPYRTISTNLCRPALKKASIDEVPAGHTCLPMGGP